MEVVIEMTIEFWRATSIRALRTICQTAIAMIGTSAVMTDVNWKMVLSASALSGILSVLTSIATGLPEVEYAEHVYMRIDLLTIILNKLEHMDRATNIIATISICFTLC